MAIGTTAAILGAAAIGGISTALGSSAQSKAAGNAADASQYAADKQFELGQQSLAFNREVYDSNKALLNPFVNNGLVASNALNALLGLPNGAAAGPAATPLPGSQTNPGAPTGPAAGGQSGPAYAGAGGGLSGGYLGGGLMGGGGLGGLMGGAYGSWTQDGISPLYINRV